MYFLSYTIGNGCGIKTLDKKLRKFPCRDLPCEVEGARDFD